MSEEIFDPEFILMDRLQKIRQVIEEYGEENFYLSYSGGKDSTVLHTLLDKAIPGNQIPRVYADTGIEFQLVRKFVMEKAKTDPRITIVKPRKNIVATLEEVGYPFKSKQHAHNVAIYQRNGDTQNSDRYLNPDPSRRRYGCPKILRYQFTPEFDLKISEKCCDELKKKPMRQYEKDSGRKYSILGVRAAEGGYRNRSQCLAFRKGKFHSFQPLVVCTDEWMDWVIEKYNIELAPLYYSPYNFDRTGCKGCPFNIQLARELKILETFLPAEKEQCEKIWKPVYDEYRRIGYRLKE